VTKVLAGTIGVNSPLLGAAAGTVIIAEGTGTGGGGTYVLSQSQTTSNATTFSTGVSIVAGQQNRVAEPNNPFFIVMTAIGFERLETNIDTPVDVKFTGSIAGSVMTVSAIALGAIIPGTTLFGVNVAFGTFIVGQLTGLPGAAGTYAVSKSQTLTSQVLASGAMQLSQHAKITFQLDFHSDDTTAGDFAQIVSNAFRDDYAVQFFAEQAMGTFGSAFGPAFNSAQNAWVAPLYADDPKQVPFVNDQNQYEWRWSLDCCLQVNQVYAPPQEFFDSAHANVISVSATFPAV
jgi:hypothetical protein